jgi:hypothetical protein
LIKEWPVAAQGHPRGGVTIPGGAAGPWQAYAVGDAIAVSIGEQGRHRDRHRLISA